MKMSMGEAVAPGLTESGTSIQRVKTEVSNLDDKNELLDCIPASMPIEQQMTNDIASVGDHDVSGGGSSE